MKNLFFWITLLTSTCASTAQDIHSSFYGHWIKKSYVNNFMTKRSIYLTQQQTGMITEFIFAKELGDSVMVCFGNSEGAKYPISFMGTSDAFLEITNKEKIQLKIKKNSDNVRVLNYIDANGSEEEFMFQNGTDLNFNAVHNWVNTQMLSGSYATSIDMGMRLRGPQEVSIFFNNDGTVKGLPGFDRYEILTHFDDIANFDVLKLINSTTKSYEWKGWEVKNNRLILYNLEPGEDYQFKKGKIYKQLEKK